MITIKAKGSFKNTESFLKRMSNDDIFSVLSSYGRKGVVALQTATPVDTGATAADWSYEIVRKRGYHAIVWSNSHMVGGTPLVVLLQYGHGTGTGGYVQGRDFINPALRPIFDQIAADVWKAVTKP